MAPASQYSAENRECANQSEGRRAGREAPNDRDGIKSPEITKWPEAIHQRGRRRAARRAPRSPQRDKQLVERQPAGQALTTNQPRGFDQPGTPNRDK